MIFEKYETLILSAVGAIATVVIVLDVLVWRAV